MVSHPLLVLAEIGEQLHHFLSVRIGSGPVPQVADGLDNPFDPVQFIPQRRLPTPEQAFGCGCMFIGRRQVFGRMVEIENLLIEQQTGQKCPIIRSAVCDRSNRQVEAHLQRMAAFLRQPALEIGLAGLGHSTVADGPQPFALCIIVGQGAARPLRADCRPRSAAPDGLRLRDDCARVPT